MKYEVVVQPAAEAAIEKAYLYLRHDVSRDVADRWYDGLIDAMLTLEEMPLRCPVAPEDEFFHEEIRHLLLRPYRIIFTVRDVRVHILHVRHMSRQALTDQEE